MRTFLGMCLALLLSGFVIPVSPQFSSDIPGVPRASVPLLGGNQGRTEFDFLYTGESRRAEEAWAGQARLGYGRSFRIASVFEFGFDFNLAGGRYTQLDEDVVAETRYVSDYNATRLVQGAFLYGLRFGAKFQPVAFVSPEGYGFSAAIGASFQPSLNPGFSLEIAGDSTWSAYPGSEKEDASPWPFPASVAVKQDRVIQVAAMGSYRSRRILADAALVSTNRSGERRFPTQRFSGFSPKLGVMFRLTPGLALGGAVWGSGASPWQDQIAVPWMVDNDPSYALVAGFGVRPEVGTDLIVMSPSGSFSESTRLYIRFRTSY
jgi:hypothetical protein